MLRRLSHPFSRGAKIFARSRRSAGRKTLAAALAVPLAATGLAFAAAGSAHAAAAAPSLGICHATGAAGHYVSESPNINATGLAGGHIGHVKDIIPPFTYTESGGTVINYPGKNWTAANQAILANNCNTPSTVTPVDPSVTQAVCTLGVLSAPTITLATKPSTVTYTVSPAAPAGGYQAGDTVTVTATTNTASVWFQSPAPGSWVYVDPTHETLSVQFDNVPCGPVKIKPVDPTWTQASCGPAGKSIDPTLTLPNTVPPGPITYSSAPAVAPSTSVTVTATIGNGAAYEFGSAAGDLPSGWARTSATTATFVVTFAAAPNCTLPQLTPVDPTVVAPSCSSGVVVPAVVTAAGAPAGITYSVSAPAADGTVTVTATIDDTKNTFAAAVGWTVDSPTTATFVVPKAADPTCTEALVLPTVAQASCDAAGNPVAPSLTLPAGSLITYSQSAAAAAGTTVTVTATVKDAAKYDFTKPIAPWTAGAVGVATYDVVFAAAPACPAVGGVGAGPTTVSPAAPSFGDPACGTSGATAPFVTTPSTPAGVTYTVSPAGPYTGGETVTVTATITDPSEQFTAPGIGGWTFVDATHETITHTFAAAPTCSGVGGLKAVSAHPTFTEATCDDGTLHGASYTLPDVDGVRYVVDGRHRVAGTYAAASGSTIDVRLAATHGFTLRDDSPIVHTFADAPTCHGVEPASTPGQPLADTGARVVPLTELGGLLIVLGAALVLGGRRRSRKAL